jgi:hypothetical protein
VFHIPKHFKWIIESHKEIIQLIRSFTIRHNHVKDKWKEASNPVDKPTSSGFLDNFFPIGHDL